MRASRVLSIVALLVLAPVGGAVVVSAAPVANDSYAVAQGTTCTVVEPVTNESQTVSAFYDYRTPNTDPPAETYSSYGTEAYQETATSTLFFYEGSEGASLVFVHDELGDADGGSTLTMEIEGLPADGEWAVRDDDYPGHDDDWVLGDTSAAIDWKWAENRTDGGAYRGLGNATGTVTLDPAFNEDAAHWGDWGRSGDGYRIEEWRLIGADGDETTLDRDRRVFVHGGDCVETPPSAALTGPDTTETGESVTLDAGDTTDDEAIGGYEWDLDGDDEIETVTTEPTVDATFDEAGERTVSVTAFDTYGNGDTADLTLNVTQAAAPPNASLTAPDEATVNETLTFDASESTDDGTITGYEWDFDGDGTFEANTTEPTVEHAYAEAGEFAPSVRVTDDDGETDTASATVAVSEPNSPPNASLDAPASVNESETLALDASNSTDDDGIERYEWDVDGDGEPEETTDGPTLEVSYDDPGTVTPEVTVVDADGSTDTANATVDVQAVNDPPTAALDAPEQATAGEPVELDASDATDDGGIAEYRWDVDGDGAIERTTTEPVVEHTYENATEVAAAVTVVDSGGLNDTATADIEVLPPDQPPNASLDAPANATVGADVTFDASNSTDDREIDAYRWDFDGDGEIEETTDEPTVEYEYEQAGTFRAAVTVVDSAGQTANASATVTVEAPASPPTAQLDAPASATVNQTITLDASNSTDEGTIVEYRWDVDGDGTVERNTTGPRIEHTYTEAGEVEPTVTVVDDDNGTATAGAEIAVSEPNSPPNASLDAPASATVNESVTLDASNSTDDDEIDAYQWDLDGDGEVDRETEEPTIEHAFTDAGPATVELTVVGADGQTATATATVAVGDPDAATAAIDVGTAGPTAGEPVAFDAGNASAASEIVGYDWAFGDGATATGATVDHTYDDAGEYEVTLTITTAGGVRANATTTVTVAENESGGGDGNDGGNDAGGGNDGNNDDGGSDAGGGNDGNDAGGGNSGNDGAGSGNGGSENSGGNGGQAGGGGGGGGQQAGGGQSTDEPEPTPEPEPDIGQANVSLESEELLVGETLVVEATVTNRGNGSGTKSVEFEVEGELLEDREVPLGPGETRTVAFTHQFTSPGNKSVEVDHGRTRTVVVRPREPNVSVASLGVEPREVGAGEAFTLTANVTNTGDAAGERSVALELFGETVATREVSLEPGESTSVSFTRSVMAPGSYDATVGNETVTVTVVDGTATPTPDATTTTDSPGLGPLAALGALAALVALLLRRRP